MNCPRCNIQLIPDTIRDAKFSVEVDLCPQCRGAWFDKGELLKLDKIVEPTMVEIRKIPAEKHQLKALYCPSCNSRPLMEKAEHPRDSKVIIDYCTQCHGIWLDKGELEAIQQESWLQTMGRIVGWLMGKE